MTINISSLKNQLSAVLRQVKQGQEALVLDRNLPVARLLPYSASRPGEGEISKKGAPKRKLTRKRLMSRLIVSRKMSAVEALLQEREESW